MKIEVGAEPLDIQDDINSLLLESLIECEAVKAACDWMVAKVVYDYTRANRLSFNLPLVRQYIAPAKSYERRNSIRPLISDFSSTKKEVEKVRERMKYHPDSKVKPLEARIAGTAALAIEGLHKAMQSREEPQEALDQLRKEQPIEIISALYNQIDAARNNTASIIGIAPDKGPPNFMPKPEPPIIPPGAA